MVFSILLMGLTKSFLQIQLHYNTQVHTILYDTHYIISFTEYQQEKSLLWKEKFQMMNVP